MALTVKVSIDIIREERAGQVASSVYYRPRLAFPSISSILRVICLNIVILMHVFPLILQRGCYRTKPAVWPGVVKEAMEVLDPIFELPVVEEVMEAPASVLEMPSTIAGAVPIPTEAIGREKELKKEPKPASAANPKGCGDGVGSGTLSSDFGSLVYGS